MKIEHKTIGSAKQATDAGEFEAVIATFGEVDSDGDVLEKGAFGGQVVSVLPAHDSRSVPLGKASVVDRGDEAVAVGQFNLEIPAARDWSSALRFDLAHPPSKQEWSWGFVPTKFRFDTLDDQEVRVIEAVDLLEVSPVLRGASVGTRTIQAKALSAPGAHECEISEAAWDSGKQARIARKLSADEMIDAYAAVDNGTKAGHFLHHFCDDDGVGPASTRACMLGIAALNGARGELIIPDDQRAAVYEHLAAHLKDAGIDAPELRDDPGMKLTDQVRLATWEVDAAVERIRDVTAARKKDGNHLADEAKVLAVQMATASGQLDTVIKKLAAMVDECETDTPVAAAVSAYHSHLARFTSCR